MGKAKTKVPLVLERLGGREFLKHTGCRPAGEGSVEAVPLTLPGSGGTGRAVVFWLDPRYRVEFWRTGGADGPESVGEEEADTVAGVMIALADAAKELAVPAEVQTTLPFPRPAEPAVA